MNRKRWLYAAAIAALIAITLNLPLTYRVGVNGVVSEKQIPLYAKACGFLYRDWMYRDIVSGITKGKKTDTEKALAILDWTDRHIKRGVPSGLDIYDDHPLNIIIRQYAARDQIEDIFTILCSYAGMKAGMRKLYNAQKAKGKVFSFVKADGRWLIFNAGKNKYFFNKEGAIASAADCLDGNLALSGEDEAEYGQFLGDVRNAKLESFTRSYEQMPLRRIFIQMEKAVNPEKYRKR